MSVTADVSEAESLALINLAAEVGAQLTRAGSLITTAESCTGGGIAAALTETAGSSNWFDCGFVTYSNRAKQQMLGINENLLHEHGAVSEQVARAMALGALQASGADVSVAVTGVAGPGGGSAEKPVGTVWFGYAHRQGSHEPEVVVECLQLPGSRARVRWQTAMHALRRISEMWL